MRLVLALLFGFVIVACGGPVTCAPGEVPNEALQACVIPKQCDGGTVNERNECVLEQPTEAADAGDVGKSTTGGLAGRAGGTGTAGRRETGSAENAGGTGGMISMAGRSGQAGSGGSTTTTPDAGAAAGTGGAAGTNASAGRGGAGGTTGTTDAGGAGGAAGSLSTGGTGGRSGNGAAGGTAGATAGGGSGGAPGSMGANCGDGSTPGQRRCTSEDLPRRQGAKVALYETCVSSDECLAGECIQGSCTQTCSGTGAACPAGPSGLTSACTLRWNSSLYDCKLFDCGAGEMMGPACPTHQRCLPPFSGSHSSCTSNSCFTDGECGGGVCARYEEADGDTFSDSTGLVVYPGQCVDGPL